MRKSKLVTIDALHELAEKKGLSLSDIARSSGLSHPTVSNAANGKPISAASAKKIAEAINEHFETSEDKLNNFDLPRPHKYQQRRHRLAKFENAAELREKAGITVEELSRLSKVGKRTITRLQNGDAIRMHNAYRIGRLLNKLLEEKGYPAEPLEVHVQRVE